jgi:hypothetical protein
MLTGNGGTTDECWEDFKMKDNPRILASAIQTARQLANQLTKLNVYFAGTPEEIKAHLEALQTGCYPFIRPLMLPGVKE